MTHEEQIRDQARIARGLATERQSLFAQLPFARELERSAQDLERMARPVMAVVGAGQVGKSALVQALGTHLPWRWLELGAPSESEPLPVDYEYRPGPGLPVGEMAEHCLVVFAMGEPPSREVLGWLTHLVDVFPEGTLQVVLTRADRPSPGISPDAEREQLTKALHDLLPHRTLSVLAVSSTTAQGLDTLRQSLMRQMAERQHALLERALQEWRTLLEDLRALLGMKDLARVRPETLSRMQVCLEELLAEEGQKLNYELPRLAEESQQELESLLPETQRRLAHALREKLGARLSTRREALLQRLGHALAREVARDVEGPVPLQLADRFGHLVEPQGLFFDWGLAQKGGWMGAGAAMLMGVARKHGGWAVVGAALLGGVLAGLLGKGERVRTDEEFQRVVTEPLVEESRKRLEEALATSRSDIERLCNVLRKVGDLFHPAEGKAYDPEHLGQVVTEAEGRRKQWDQELEQLQWKQRLAGLETLANALPSRS